MRTPKQPRFEAELDEPASIAPRLLAWYADNARVLPWRVPPHANAPNAGQRPDAYRVWLSEVMLQQTTVKAVIPYFEAFVRRWPDVAALAAAPEAEVMRAWAGLGYYARARNMRACAHRVATELGGRFPTSEAALRALPGLGAYTAAAVAAIAFGERAVVVDGNVERVLARLAALETPLPAARPLLRQLAARITPALRFGDFAQAMMDLGATVCTPRAPACARCPLAGSCRARSNAPESFPRKLAKAARPARIGRIYLLERADGAVLVETRPESGLLGGMTGLPSTPWGLAGQSRPDVPPVAGAWQDMPGRVRHVFTHFSLELTMARLSGAACAAPAGLRFAPPETLADEAFPTVMRKVLVAAGLIPQMPAPRAPSHAARRSA